MRIGLVLNVLNEEYQISLFKGIKKEAGRIGVEVVCFQLEGVPFAYVSFANQFPSNEIFNLDGIILVTSSITDCYNIKTKEQIEKIWPGIPVVSLAQGVEDIPSIMIQSGSSMKILVEHLIRYHHYENFLFIKGPEFHYDANERKYIFEKTMDMYKTWVPELRYSEKEGAFIEVDGTKAMEAYYKENHSLPDAVVCANDNMAIGVYKFLKMKTRHVKKCAVTGFDDVPQSKFMVPSLTTVHQPLTESGIKAVDLLINYINHNEIQMKTYVESSVLFRESCGCNSHADREEKSEQILEDMQKNYVHSEELLKVLGHFGQELIFCDSYEFLRNSLENYFKQLDVRNYCILVFPEYINPDSRLRPDELEVIPVYMKQEDADFSLIYEKKIAFNDFVQLVVDDYGFTMKNKIVKYLNNASQLIGLVIYECDFKILSFLCSVCILLSQTLFRIKNIEREKKRAVYLEKEVTKRTKELVLANEKRLKVEAEVLKISELERQRFSLDLHDDICQRLAGISMLCRSYSNREEGVQKTEMAELAQLINDTLQRTRQYAHNSYPVELESLGLNGSLNNLCNSFSHQNSIVCDYKWNISDSIIFNNLQKLNIFRIIQEALHNIQKHACAKQVWINIDEYKKNLLRFMICDDGKGFALEDLEKKGLGLSSMEYRANQIGAELKVGKNKPKGSKIELIMKMRTSM